MPIICFQGHGARLIRRWLEKRVVTELSNMLVNEEIDENSTVYIDAADNKKRFMYRMEKKGGAFECYYQQTSYILI